MLSAFLGHARPLLLGLCCFLELPILKVSTTPCSVNNANTFIPVFPEQYDNLCSAYYHQCYQCT